MGEDRQTPELPKDVEGLQALVAQLHASNAALYSRNAKLQEQGQIQEKKITVLKQRIADLCVEVYGPRSEKARYYNADQGLFEFMKDEDLKHAAEKIEAEAGTLTVPAHERKKPGRRSEFPDHLMQLRVRHELEDDQRVCSCGTLMLDAGILTKKALERIELIFLHVDEICRYKCPGCGQSAVADLPDRLIDDGILGPSAIAQVIYDRFACHMPYARIESKWAAEGVDIDRSVLSTTVGRVAELLEPVHDAVKEDILNGALIQSDSTTVIQRDGPRPGTKRVNVFCWIAHGRGTFFNVFDGLSRDGPQSVLSGKEFLLQTDGHKCYKENDSVIGHAGCWAHLRRYFRKDLKKGSARSKIPINLIGRIFEKERELKELRDDPCALLEARRREVLPLVEEFYTWNAAKLMELDAGTLDALPKSNYAKGIKYAHNQRQPLRYFLENGKVRDITNNASERALRAVVIGRKNWGWFGSENGAKTGTILMGLVQTCKDLGISPHEYLRDVMQQINVLPADEIGRLIPRNWKRDPEAQRRIGIERERVALMMAKLEPQS